MASILSSSIYRLLTYLCIRIHIYINPFISLFLIYSNIYLPLFPSHHLPTYNPTFSHNTHQIQHQENVIVGDLDPWGQQPSILLVWATVPD